MKIKKKELLRLSQGLESVKGLKGVKFAYAVAKNSNLIKPEVEAINKASMGSDEFIEFERKRVELAKVHSIKGDNGEALTQITSKGQQFKIKDTDAFQKDLEELKKKNKKVLDQREKQKKEVDSILEEEIKIDFLKIKSVDLPEDINAGQIESIIELID